MRQYGFKSQSQAALVAIIGAIALAGCSQTEEQAAYEASADIAEEAMMEAAAEDSEASSQIGSDAAQASALPDIPVSMPKIAYTYDYAFALPGDGIADLQKKHADMCEAQGPFSCRIIGMSHSGDDGEYASGRLQLAVAAPKARAFGEALNTATGDAGGEQVSATIAGEDLSKQIIDTDARLQARTILRDRLLEVLRTRRGSVRELVEAERSVAQVNEEIDQAKSWLEEMRARVAFSRVDIAYESTNATGGSFLAPIKSAFASVGTITGNVLGGLIMLLAILIPLAGLGYGLHWVRRKFLKDTQKPVVES